jgi:hypothetical protein
LSKRGLATSVAKRIVGANTQNQKVTAYEDVEARLRAFKSAPFLFVGAGVGRRYLGTDNWVELLRRLAAHTDKPYAYYASKAGNDYPSIASEIAAVFHEIWWSDEQFEDSRAAHGETLTDRQGPLKVEVAAYTRGAMADVAKEGPKAEELALLAQAVIDGVITTNYDELMESIFKDFKTYIGESDLLFADSQGVGEIYKIHGCATRPDSLVLTKEDYDRFNERNPYLAAKLLAIFVEHPVIFLGYSLNDPDVTAILVSIAKVLTTENLRRLADRLFFVDWDPDVQEPTVTATQMAVSGFSIPVVLVKVPDFAGLFRVLGGLPRQFPARLLRLLKEQVYDLVLSNEPSDSVTVVDIEDDTNLRDIDFVLGVGVRDQLGGRGYIGLTRKDLLQDVLRKQSALVASRVVADSLPILLRGVGNNPVYRYLRGAGLLRDDGTLLPDADVDTRIKTRVGNGMTPFRVHAQQINRARRLLAEADEPTVAALIQEYERLDVLLAVGVMNREDIDMEAFREFLAANSDMVNRDAQTTAWAKAVCLYDYYRYGVVAAPSPSTT